MALYTARSSTTKRKQGRSHAEVFRYPNRTGRDGAVPKRYKDFLRERGEPYRCDIPEYILHKYKRKAKWNGKDMLSCGPRKMVFGDSNFDNLRLVCPNCASQLDTHAGANRGRVVIYADEWYLLKRRLTAIRLTIIFNLATVPFWVAPKPKRINDRRISRREKLTLRPATYECRTARRRCGSLRSWSLHFRPL